MIEPSDWPPAASLETLRIRARLLSAVRSFFDERGYWEVDTPLVSQERVIDANLDPFVAMSETEARSNSKPSRALFLQTSPEFAMKRLLAAGADAIYQLSHVFRQGELGRLHNPEFTMVEWYRVGDSHLAQMQIVEELVLAAFAAVREAAIGREPTIFVPPPPAPSAPFLRTTYRAALATHAGADLAVMDVPALAAWSRERQLHPPPGLEADNRDDWLNWLLAELVEPHLGRDRPEFVCDYPASQASLARIRAESPPVAERFELYYHGIELCNGYHELPDAQELRRRIEDESKRRSSRGQPPLPVPERLLNAMESGLPDCAGVALGFDRLFMLALGAHSVHEVLPFSFEQS